MKIRFFSNIRIQFLYKMLLSMIYSSVLSCFGMLVTVTFIISIGGKTFNSWQRTNHHHVYVLFILILWLVLMFVFITIFIFYILTKKTINSIKNISKIVQEISDGNLGITIPILGNDEISLLSKNINHMSMALKDLIEKDKKSEMEKKDLLNHISHDLRTPLTVIIGYLDIILQNKCNEKDKNEFLNITHKKALQLNTLVNQLFEFSKIDSAIIELNKVHLNLVELIEQIVTCFMQIFKENNIIYTLKNKHVMIDVCIDADLMVRAFENILTNAVKYGASGGKIDVEISLQGKEVHVSISDYGDPILVEESSKIFDKLYRLKISKTQDGTGLGLTIAKSIIELNHGKIQLEITGEKKSFIVILPLL